MADVKKMLDKVDRQRRKIKKLKQERDELQAKVDHHRAKARAAKRKYQAIKDHVETKPTQPGPDTPLADQSPESPDSSWTVAKLRAEAKNRSITGYSRLSKAELIKALNS